MGLNTSFKGLEHYFLHAVYSKLSSACVWLCDCVIGLYHSTDPKKFDKFPENVARETFSVAIINVSFSSSLF